VRKALAEREHAEMLLEGRANQFTVDSETKLQQQLNAFKRTLADGEISRAEQMARIAQEAADLMARLKKEAEAQVGPLRKIEAEITNRVLSQVGGGLTVGSGDDGAIRQMRDKTQSDLLETMIKTLRIELMREISGCTEDSSVIKDEIAKQAANIN
jgi:hypothetical protein